MLVYTLEQRFATWVCNRLTEDGKKKIIFSAETHFDLGRYVSKQNCSIWGTENPHARVLWKADAPKASHCLCRERPLQSMTIVNGPCWTKFCPQKMKRRIFSTFGFNRTALRATKPKLHSMFCAVFEDRIISRWSDVVWPPRSCDLTPLEYYLWGAVKDECYADKPETIDAFKDNIREVITEIQLHRIDNVLKNWTDCVGYCMPIWMK